MKPLKFMVVFLPITFHPNQLVYCLGIPLHLMSWISLTSGDTWESVNLVALFCFANAQGKEKWYARIDFRAYLKILIIKK